MTPFVASVLGLPDRQYREAAAVQIATDHPDRSSLRRRLAVSRVAKQLEAEGENFSEEPFDPKAVIKAWASTQAITVGIILTVFAIGAYFIGLETHLRLPLVSWAFMTAGALIAAAALVFTIRAAIGRQVISTGKKAWRFIAPGIFVGLAVGAVGYGFWRIHLLHPDILDTTALWHFVQPIDFVRHGWRTLMEGVAVNVGRMAFAYNVYSFARLRRLRNGPRWWDYIEIWILRIPNLHDDDFRRRHRLPQLSPWQVFMTLAVWQFVYAAAIIWPALTLVHHFQKDMSAQTTSVVYFVIGFVAGHVARRPLAAVIDEFQKWRSQQFVAAEHDIKWWHHVILSPYYIERLRRTEVTGVQKARESLGDRSNAMVAAFMVGGLVLVAVGATGVYVKVRYGA